MLISFSEEQPFSSSANPLRKDPQPQASPWLLLGARALPAPVAPALGRAAGARQEPEEDAEGHDRTWRHAAMRLGPSGRPWAEICSWRP